MSGSVEHIGARRILVQAGGKHMPAHPGEQCRPVGHRAVDHLPLPAHFHGQQGTDHAERQHHPATAKVAHIVHRRHGALAFAADSVQHSRQRDIVDVVPRCLSIRAKLPPSGHPPVNELWVVSEQQVGTKPHPLHNARSIALDQSIGRPTQVTRHSNAVSCLRVQDNRGAVARQGIARIEPAAGTFDTDNAGTVIGQHHPAKRRRPDTGEFDDLESVEWSWHLCVS